MPTDNLRPLVGTSSFLFELAAPGIGQILKAAGADFAAIDMPHTSFGFDTVRQVVRYCQAAGLPLVVQEARQVGRPAAGQRRQGAQFAAVGYDFVSSAGSQAIERNDI